MPRKVPQIEMHREAMIKIMSDLKAIGATRAEVAMSDRSKMKCDFTTEALDRGAGRGDLEERPPSFLKRGTLK